MIFTGVAKPTYGHEVEIVKKECVGHLQKRCGTTLQKLKTECGTKKLEDHKTLCGKGHLTNVRID